MRSSARRYFMTAQVWFAKVWRSINRVGGSLTRLAALVLVCLSLSWSGSAQGLPCVNAA